MGCFESKCEILYEYNLSKSGLLETKHKYTNIKYKKEKHKCSKEFKIYLKKNFLAFEYYNIAYKSFNDSCICESYNKCYICHKKHINFNTIYCSFCEKCVINNLYYHCYDCNKCKPIIIDHCENIKKHIY